MFSVPQLSYSYDALEGAISERTMRLHHDKHHQTYVDKLNKALEGQEHDADIEQVLRHLDALPTALQQTVRDQGGGHFNHSLFWQWLSPDGGGQPAGALGEAVVAQYGDFQQFVDQFSAAATGLFGSGWVWLMPDLQLITTKNQDNPITQGQPTPLLGLDAWEHAYYLDYQNQRDRYIAAWWGVINWAEVEKRFTSGIIH